jgi:hypothetical protein
VHREIHLLPSARADPKAAFDWYEKQEQGLGGRFLSSVDSAFETIRERPAGFPIRFGSYRRIQWKTFPSTVYCKLRDDLVIVNCVSHTSQNPVRLKSRLGIPPV